MFAFFKPAPHKKIIPDNQIDPEYKKMRLKVFMGIFLGYAGYYLVRKNFVMVMPELISMGYTKSELGVALSAISIAYGISKFLMASVSDRSHARYFLASGLLLSALTMLFMAFCPWATSSILIIFILLFLNGWFQGMGWPPCARVMVHWFSTKERGMKMSIWNVAHNVGGGLIGPLAILGFTVFGNWESKIYFPAFIALIIVGFILYLVHDTPQSCGLPPIEIYKQDNTKPYSENDEKELSFKEILFKNVLNNKLLWYIAFANAFIYLVRYGVLDWAPTYLEEVKGLDKSGSAWAYFGYEYAGIAGILLCGWMSDRLFNGRRTLVNIIFMLLVSVAVFVYWKNPAGNPLVDNLALIAIGFLIYGPLMLIGVQALDLVRKKAAGTAAGLTGLFGYLGGAVFANIAMGYVVDNLGWDGGFIMLISACFLSVIFLLPALKREISDSRKLASDNLNIAACSDVEINDL